ncbi:transcriptional regulator [Kitasatospora xanthocidica]|uniref:helix-turn-helix domain-containing protein n=1 Tax=Kitasatospora xanthocidica TaxID=83382 RepID=UPI00167739FB|nr:transcriptional regulator [Kitasatospora xanthocidica]
MSELKTRSGLSYGTLAKRLHMSTSTLHRYCSGTALPNEYTPVERFARVCRATPDELVELHRNWILADAGRGRRADRAPVAEPPPVVEPSAVDLPAAVEPPSTVDLQSAVEPVVEVAPPPVPPRRRRTALIASAVAVVLLAAVVVVVRPAIWGGDDAGDRQAAGATSTGTATTGTATTATGAAVAPDPSPSAPTPPDPAPPQSPTATPTAGPTPTPSETAPPPLTVRTRPYVYEDQCSQHFLVNSGPAQVGPPAGESDAPRWAAAFGAVSSGEQLVALTVQGTGAETVVLEALHVRIAAKGAPLAWNDYAMGVGCGGGVETKSFDVDLDRGSPAVTVKGGQRDFPYKVSKSDPEVFYVTAHTKAHDVRWDLTLEWSSGGRRGTVRVDNSGTPFRTSADVGRPGYDYPPGGGEWIKRTGG